MEFCHICSKDIESKDLGVCVLKKGLMSLLDASLARNDNRLEEYFREKLTEGTLYVHKDCRKRYTDPRKIQKSLEPQAKRSRTSTDKFRWKIDCFFCGEECAKQSHTKNPGRQKFSRVETLELRKDVLESIGDSEDPFLSKIRSRLLDCFDLVSVEAVYHSNCYVKFLDKKDRRKSRGRPVDQQLLKAFDNTCQWFESIDRSTTMKELHEYMNKEAGGDEHTGSITWLKQKLIDKYHTDLHITSDGYRSIVTLKEKMENIISETWYKEKCDDINDEKERIIATAAKLIKAEIKDLSTHNKEYYPQESEISSVDEGEKWLPEGLIKFLHVLVPSLVKRISIGQSIVYAARPKYAFPPILFGLGVELDHVFGSRWLVEHLSRIGFCISYQEVVRYKQSVLQAERVEDHVATSDVKFAQWSADNVDHNIITLDGKNTFHGMGVIVSATSDENDYVSALPRVQRKDLLPVQELSHSCGIPIVQYEKTAKSGLDMELKKRIELSHSYEIPQDYALLNNLWHLGWILDSTEGKHSNWSGYMQMVESKETLPETSDVHILPIIDMDPGNLTCIYSTLLYTIQQASLLNIPTPCITFDQPLWLKAMDVVKSKNLEIVVKLGGFHMLMSFLGSIGMSMEGSGLENAFSEIYAGNVVPHMLSGKAYARALRGHFLVHAALMYKIYQEILDEMEPVDVPRIKEILANVSNKTIYREDVGGDQLLQKVYSKIKEKKNSLSAASETAKLWVQYSEYIEVVKSFITAERVGDWNFHLYATEKMLNLFAATGHVNYAKSARLYLQLMQQLPNTHPWLHQKFADGFFTVRRNKRFWSGLWSDIIIEQVMMKSLKSRGGLTTGRGMTESVRHQWIHSMHRCSAIHNAVTMLTGSETKSSEQHQEMGKSRCNRDHADFQKILNWFSQHEPFDLNAPGLRSLSTGITATKEYGINCNCAESVGLQIQSDLDGEKLFEAEVKRKAKIKTLSSLYSNVKLGQSKLNVNPMVLFPRLIAIAQREDNVAQFFKYEMAAEPASLFKEGLMRKPDKPQLRRAITIGATEEAIETHKTDSFVLDGGALVHKVRWVKGETYQETVCRYVEYIKNKFGICCIVFDGYENSCTKDEEHQRRSTIKTSPDVIINEQNTIYSNQEAFLANNSNKTQLIKLLEKYMKIAGNTVVICPEDPDTQIASKAIELAHQNKPVTVVADDTDVFLLLVYHIEPDIAADIYFMSEKAKKMWNINKVARSIEPIVRSNILFLHAWTGCDTTSAIFGHGKSSLLKKIKSSSDLQRIAKVFRDPWARQEDVIEHGAKTFVLMYGGKGGDQLNTFRYNRFMSLVSSNKSTLSAEKLPPTNDSAQFHSLRVHLQVIVWITLDTLVLDPLLWGWKKLGSRLVPIKSNLPPAPDKLLNFVRCRCNITSRNPCGGNTCNCRKNGLHCVSVCGDCHGENCLNHNKEEEPTLLDEMDDCDEVDEERNIFNFLDDVI